MVLHAPGGRHAGWDAFVVWYRRRREAEGRDFGWRVEELLAGERHAAALVRLVGRGRSWQQVAVYRVERGRIAEIRLYEGEPEDGG